MNWIDVGTLALPRLLTERCIGSLLEMMNRDGYRLRWIFHLDVLPAQAWSAKNWLENVRQAERMANRFDDAILLLPRTRQGFGPACRRVFLESCHDLLWIEDDWLWLKPFEFTAVVAASRDGYNFGRPGVRAGCTTPSYWKRPMIEYLLANYPQPATTAREIDFKRILYHRGGFRNNMHQGRVPRGSVTDVGRNSPYGGYWPLASAAGAIAPDPTSHHADPA